MTDSSTDFFNDSNSDPKVYICTDVCLFDEKVVSVEPTTKRRPVIYFPVAISCPCSDVG